MLVKFTEKLAKNSLSKRLYNTNSGFRNPYLTAEEDHRFSKYSVLMIRTIDVQSDLIGPATAIFHGIPTTTYNRSSIAVATIMNLQQCNRVFLHDANTAIHVQEPINWDLYPCITIPALLHLYKKSQSLEKNKKVTFIYNETFVPTPSDMVTCLVDFCQMESVFELQKEKEYTAPH